MRYQAALHLEIFNNNNFEIMAAFNKQISNSSNKNAAFQGFRAGSDFKFLKGNRQLGSEGDRKAFSYRSFT